jgi:RHS repeat-associated protein
MVKGDRMKKAIYIIVLLTLVFQTGFLSGISVSAQGETPEPPTPTVEPTLTPEPTATETASPTPTITETPTSVETALPIAPVVEVQEVTLSLSTSPTYLKRGGELAVDWSIEGLGEMAKGLTLRFTLPSGMTVMDPKSGTWNEKENRLDVEVTEWKGSISLLVGEKVETPAVIAAELLQEGNGLAKAEVSLLEASETLVESKGGSVEGMKGRVLVNFPEGALAETVKVSIEKPSKEALPVQSLSGAPFEVTAVSENSKAEVSKFAQPVEIQVAYSEAGLTDESDLLLYWYDPTDGQWKLPLSQHVDKENNLLIATTDHFTVFDTYNANWQTAVTPTLESFQTSGFTGAASFSMPIKVPAGPGGFQPNLSLSYSSSTVDNAGSQTQASWVGMGWSMTTSYIERIGHGTNGVQDDSYALNLNGMSVELLPGADGKYHASDENFYKTEFTVPNNDEQQSSWTISDKTGNKYYFEDRTNMWKTQTCTNGYDLIPYVWRWSLTRVENVHGQVMNYTYQKDNKNIQYYSCDQHASSVLVDTWVYPYQITYSNGRYRIRFIREATRLDYRTLWANQYSTYTAFQKSKLTNIRVEQVNSDGSATLIRRYDFAYANTIFPDYYWDAGGRTLSLRTVQEVAGNGATLPAYTFYYDDKMHLSDATNGYGGTVSYEYDNWHETIPYENWDDNLPEYLIPEWGSPAKFQFTAGTEGWAGVQPPPTSGVSYMGGGTIKVWGVAGYPNLGDGGFAFQPGRWYVILADMRSADGGANNSVRLGFSVGTSGGSYNQWGSSVPLTNQYQLVSSGPIQLSKDAISFSPRIDSTGSYNQVRWLYIYPLPTAYRVTSQTVAAGSDSYTWDYDYEGAATNIPLISNPDMFEGNSEAAAGTQPYIKPYTEFRGHSRVSVTDPYGGVTVTNYDQSDCLSGRVTSAEVYNGTDKVQSSSYEYACDPWASTIVLKNLDTTSPGYDTFYDSLEYRWARTTSETSRVHDADGQETAHTTTTYGYNANHGNLVQQNFSGTNVDTLVTHIEYYSYTADGKWLVGLPARTYIQSGNEVLAESLNLYEAQKPGVLTGTRTWVSGTLYSQANLGYDDYGNVTSQTSYSGYWDSNYASTPPSGARTTNIVYDSTYHTYPTSITNALGQTTLITYDYLLGMPTGTRDANYAWTYATYDAFGRFTSLTRPGETTPSLTVSYQNSPFKVTLSQVIDSTHTFTATRTYDGLGRQTQVATDNNTYIVDYTYGYENGARVDKQSMPHTSAESTYWTKVKYDSMARPLTVTATDGTFTSYAYNGLVTTVTDGNGNQTSTTTNILGQTLSVNAPDGPDLSFDYYELGTLKTATRSGNIVTMTYDKAGRKTGMTDPDMGTWSYGYDALGNLTTQTDARGCMLAMTYDLLNRLDTKISSGTYCGQQVSVNYDYDSTTNGNKGIGRRTFMSDDSGSTEWKYDINGQLIRETKTIIGHSAFETNFTYNSAGLPMSMEYPDEETVTNTYDDRMMLDTVIGDDATYVSDTQYDSAGRMTSHLLGNGVTQKYLYKPWNTQGGRLDKIVAGTGTWNSTTQLFATTLQKSAYSYDPVGNITSIYDSMWGETQTFGYDELNRLVSASAEDGLADYSEIYTYDSGTGNLLTKGDLTVVDQNQVGEYKLLYDANHPHAVGSLVESENESNAVGSYEYDSNGNMETRDFGGQEVDLDYDAENRLVSATGTNLSAQFTYNGDGQRVKSVINNETTYFAGGYFELNATTGEVSKYYFAGASRIAVRKYIVPETTTLNYLLGDHLGSTSMVTNATGGLEVETRYKPWGEVRFTTTDKTLPTRYTFTGQYSYVNDDATDLGNAGFGLMFYNARWYDPALGRMAQADTVVSGMQGLDRYLYVNNSPVRYNDPTGHDPNCRNQLECAKFYGVLNPNQVEVSTAVKTINQYKIDPNLGLGGNGCGAVAASYAGASLKTMADALYASGEFYIKSDDHHTGGIQPSYYAAAVKDVYGINRVAVYNRKDPLQLLKDLSYEIQAGSLVIIDFLDPDLDAHYAVITEIDFTGEGTVTIDNTLGGEPWSMSFEDFFRLWLNPEQTAASAKDDAEPLDYWAIVIRKPVGTAIPQ